MNQKTGLSPFQKPAFNDDVRPFCQPLTIYVPGSVLDADRAVSHAGGRLIVAYGLGERGMLVNEQHAWASESHAQGKGSMGGKGICMCHEAREGL